MLALYKRWKRYNEIQLTKKMHFNNQKRKIIHHPPSESHIPRLIPWETILETKELITIKSNLSYYFKRIEKTTMKFN